MYLFFVKPNDQLFLVFFSIQILFFGCAQLKQPQGQESKEVLVLLAHYDDETILAPILLTLQQQGATINAVYVTEGEGGKDIRALPADFETEQARIDHLRLTRAFEMRRVLNYLPMNLEQLNMPDTPLRIPEPGYPNPLGRPSTDGSAFLKKNIWNTSEIIKKLSFLQQQKKWNPHWILTLGNDPGVTHAHHQAVQLIAREWIDQSQQSLPSLKAHIEVLETPNYLLDKFKPRPMTAAFKLTPPMIEAMVPIYRSHQSQQLSLRPIEELAPIPVLFAPVPVGWLADQQQQFNQFKEFAQLMPKVAISPKN